MLDDLAAQLEVSRTPVRVALTRLAVEGLVQPTGRMGFHVTRLAAEEMMHLYDVRLMCETFAVQRGIGNVTPKVIHQMEEVLIKPGASPLTDPKERLAQVLRDGCFHQSIVDLPQNPTLSDLFRRLNIHIHGMRVGPLPFSPAEQAALNNAEHAAIIEALGRLDAEAAQEALRVHIANSAGRAVASMQMALDGLGEDASSPH